MTNESNMTVREQKFLFTLPIVWMFGAFLWATIACPAPLDNERPILFALGVSSTLVPAFAFLGFARWASRREV